MGDGTCEGCRQGHYAMEGGLVTNFPCTTDGCLCWFCGPVKTPAQAAARAVYAARPSDVSTTEEKKP